MSPPDAMSGRPADHPSGPGPDPSPKQEPQGFNRVTLMLAGLVFLVGLIPLVAALVLFQLHSDAEMEKAEITAHRMATLLMRSFEQAVEPIDALLQNFASNYDHSAAPYQIYEQLKDFSVPPLGGAARRHRQKRRDGGEQPRAPGAGEGGSL
ncbi:hypothetical protein [Xanthobacter wiegelii]|uniref:hypothetical protein n=1 Tax=Xanthobacter wiegelii TaxID=3119913 RepID=UPI003728B71A